MMICNLCGERESRLLYTRDGTYIVKCIKCKTAYLSPQADKTAIDRLYTQDYYRSWGVENEKIDKNLAFIKRVSYEKRLTEIERYVKKGKILDIGCAFGFSLEIAKEKGWMSFGIEKSDFARKIAQSKVGAEYVFKDLEEIKSSNQSFDAITMTDLLEHVTDPGDFLKRAVSCLKPSGVIALTTPDIESFSAKVMKKYWVHLKPEHLYYFSPETISLLFNKVGLMPLKIVSCRKILNLAYICSQFKIYPTPIVSHILTFIHAFFPLRLLNIPINLRFGEMFVLGRKK